jgi:beta-fructofuranosidase
MAVDTGEMWECPDFFPLDGKHVLLYSTERKVYWEIGELDKSAMKFHMETRGLLDHGAYYAMKSMIDAKGRRILWGWVQEKRPDAELIRAGWSGCMALPRILSIGPDNTLRMEVPPEFDALRQDMRTLSIRKPDAAVISEWLGRNSVRNRAAAVAYSFTPSDKPLTFAVFANDVTEPLFQIAYNGDVARPALVVGDKMLSLTPDSSGLSAVQFWMDGSVIEIFADRKEAITLRNYTATSGNLRIAAKGAVESVHSLHVSGVAPISADRLTS